MVSRSRMSPILYHMTVANKSEQVYIIQQTMQ